MGKMINLAKKGPVTVYANGMLLHIDIEDDNKLIATIESEEGGQYLDIHPHEELPNTIVFELQKPVEENPRPRFHII
ncbi:hypothetical protein PVA44_00845 [Entomospira nematocerorum]|uniref:Uncharacterized protein n=1 Tax=Entomospira nematocerorum TaxID=2719987 RepID=A0A968KT92_9SPIO|nr:hypothetical protein [Entomospira nematocera]NIZ47415.1 hypothetical protein [Entomospira nematocera]WDI34046.1 hypothetical protein PVA44_00845 [Entomospira nematocera]